MSNEEQPDWAPAFMQDPRKFDRLRPKDSVDAWIAEFDDDLQEALAAAAFGFGMTGFGPTDTQLTELYRYCLASGMSAARRWQVFSYVTDAVRRLNFLGIDAYLPFIAEDPDRQIACVAAKDYVANGPLIANDPMSRVKEIIGLIRVTPIVNVGAVFGGLMCLGDPRVCRLLRDTKNDLSRDQAEEAARCWSGVMSAATVEFVVDWLESLEGGFEDTLFAGLVSNLLLQKRDMQVPMVTTGMLALPIESVSPEERLAMAKFIPFDDYCRRIAPRLLALESKEAHPKTMSMVISSWGIADRDLTGFPDINGA
jgi:hypothetical protein